MSNTFIRSSDGMAVTDAEALDSGRRLRPGYKFGPKTTQHGEYIGFDMAFMDSANRVYMTDAMLNDAETTFRDSAAGREFIAFRRSCFDMANRTTGRQWSAADEALAVKHGVMEQTAARQRIAAQDAARPGLAAAEAAARAAHAFALNNRTV